MSRYSFTRDEITFSYGFDRPLAEYFLMASGPTVKLAEFCSAHSVSMDNLSCDTDDDGKPVLDDEPGYLHLVGSLSDKYGGKMEFLEAVQDLKLGQMISPDHLFRAAMDLPF